MTTTAFKNVRSLSQLVSVLLIVINIPLPFFLIPHLMFVRMEAEHLRMGIRGITTIFRTTSMTNITLGLFASCGINSKTRLYMRLYFITGMLLLLMLVTMLLYIRISYQSDVSRQLGRLYNNASIRNIILYFMECTNQMTCTRIIMKNISMIKYYYVTIAIPSLCLNLLNLILIRIAISINIEAPPQKLPNFVEKTRVGMNTSSLRNKRVIVNGPGQESRGTVP
ncbi:hypothetical protein EHEL_091050 [Encephalitozoon hellem ATCC 50504]|uniref:Uncharacterized protein n=1 Tax=Encephalitozoon hellem TaxID=27973 RepID=A0A9Q9FA62_ENCHE|nr:uncharacterized protein EHEL_091050 [Encephalitozoon hellem ATCC 50504]AFM99000.1 hypothetical protein EHEL_091050 [Encephalitozoon hellem ATCC 50504]UTX44016.1 hypothetical protein GPU96_09g17960 [Encephalitozoon hellem]WEL39501.1 hypothetical protein PFJ87_09g01290 [Encephalitozoon hellem]|eukprot:XP_003887981.1 hypothetical protein EHEL_091050 [Encephalitozoon hellem ATCC 50504]